MRWARKRAQGSKETELTDTLEMGHYVIRGTKNGSQNYRMWGGKTVLQPDRKVNKRKSHQLLTTIISLNTVLQTHFTSSM